GDLEWTISNLDNVGIHAGLSASNSVWTGTAWVVGTNLGTFRSSTGVEPWTRTPLGIDPLSWAAFAPLGHHLFAAFDTQTFAVMAQTDDDGATWTDAEFLPGAFVKDLAISGGNLYAGRGDGLWRRSVDATSAPPAPAPAALRFAVAGAMPIRDRTQLRF